jgi:AhpD family alkylhydroperoxidase
MNRIDYGKTAPEVRAALLAMEDRVRASSLERKLLDLVYLRVSQINRCAFCVDMHARDLEKAGESSQRLALVAVWHEARGLFTAREQAAFAWAEAVTKCDVDAAVYEETLGVFGAQSLVELNLAVATINAWNRFGVAFQMTPPARSA